MHPGVANSLLVSRPSRLGRFLGFSVAVHVGVVLAAVVYAKLVAGPSVDLNAKPIRATLVRLGKPRDQKLLPRKEQLPPPPQEVKSAAPPSPAPAPPSNAVAVPVPGVKPSPAPQPAPQKGEKTGDARKRLFGAFDKMAKTTPPDELEGAEDGDPNGDSATAEGERYYGLLSSQVRQHYNVADTIPDAERIRLKAQVAVRLSRKGEVLDVRLATSSGNDLFDSAVLSAVKKASPFSPPPDHIRDSLQKHGVVLEFRP